MGRTAKVGLLVVLVLTLATAGSAAELPPGGSFSDDNGNIHEGNIEAIREAGVTRGCNPPANDKYCPSGTVTRGAMAAFLTRALDLPPSTADYFSDDAGHLFENEINSLAEAGITKGCNPPANDLYCPDGTVTRGQMAAFLSRALNLPLGGADLFTDDDESVFEADIDKLATAGITLGCNPPTNDRYCPFSTVKRDQMASFLARALKLAPIVPPPPVEPPPLVTFGGGTWLVPSEVPPGLYRNSTSSAGCYAERLSGLGGSLGEIIANEFTFELVLVEITGTEVAFSSSDCGTWTNNLGSRSNPLAPFGGGYFRVDEDIAPGTWRNSDSSEGCYWERLRGFSWTLSDIITNEFTFDLDIVTISETDVGFMSDGCGTWTKIG